MQRVIEIEPASLKGVSRVVGVAGGRRKVRAIHAALRGGWINVLITDLRAAESLLSSAQQLHISEARVSGGSATLAVLSVSCRE
jgi:hypothetical protein